MQNVKKRPASNGNLRSEVKQARYDLDELLKNELPLEPERKKIKSKLDKISGLILGDMTFETLLSKEQLEQMLRDYLFGNIKHYQPSLDITRRGLEADVEDDRYDVEVRNNHSRLDWNTSSLQAKILAQHSIDYVSSLNLSGSLKNELRNRMSEIASIADSRVEKERLRKQKIFENSVTGKLQNYTAKVNRDAINIEFLANVNTGDRTAIFSYLTTISDIMQGNAKNEKKEIIWKIDDRILEVNKTLNKLSENVRNAYETGQLTMSEAEKILKTAREGIDLSITNNTSLDKMNKIYSSITHIDKIMESRNSWVAAPIIEVEKEAEESKSNYFERLSSAIDNKIMYIRDCLNPVVSYNWRKALAIGTSLTLIGIGCGLSSIGKANSPSPINHVLNEFQQQMIQETNIIHSDYILSSIVRK